MASRVLWSSVPACMVPSAQTVRENKYVTTAGIVKFAVGQQGSIVFVANIVTSLPAGRYVLRAHLEREDPAGSNEEPPLLGTNVRLRRRRGGTGGVEDILTISGDPGLPVLGENGVYHVDSPGRDLDGGISIEDFFYWVQLEVQQQTPATTATRNAVIGLRLFGRVP